MLTTLRSLANKVSNKVRGVVYLPAEGKKRGTVLISYLTEPFTKAPWEPLSNFHTNYWECLEMARLFAVRGYDVDVINWNDRSFAPQKPYRICVDVQDNLARLAPHLPADCVTVMHVTTSEQQFQNEAEHRRLAALKERRGIELLPQRELAPTKDPELAEYLEGFGNKTVHATYEKYGKPIFPIPISVVREFPFPEKDFVTAQKSFLWLGGGGAVLKGLDLVLEAFRNEPSLTLHVCGPIVAEKDFARAYHAELFETPNIHYHGRIDVASPLFAHLINECGALIYPAFSEGTSGAVVQAMHAGLIPIITPETGIDENAPCLMLEEPSVEAVAGAVRAIAATPAEGLRAQARAVWEFARRTYTRDAFSTTYASFISTVLKL